MVNLILIYVLGKRRTSCRS